MPFEKKILFCLIEYIFDGLFFFFRQTLPVTFQNSSTDPEKWHSCFYLEKLILMKHYFQL